MPVPPSGRRYTRAPAACASATSSPGGRLRLDGLARYLQDVSNDDTPDAGLRDDRRGSCAAR